MCRKVVILSRVSVLLSVALAAVWIASVLGYGPRLTARWKKNHPPTFCVFVERNHLGVGVFRHLPNDVTPPGEYWIYLDREYFQNILGIVDTGYLIFLHVQFAALIAFTGAPILILILARKRTFGPGQCASCGYDVRASPEKCSECGTTVPSTMPLPSRGQ